MTRPKFSTGYWIKERVATGGQRFIRDFFEGREETLPTNQSAYRNIVDGEVKGKYEGERLYPPVPAILRFHESLAAFWWSLGFLVEVKCRERKWKVTPEMDEMLRRIYAVPFKARERPKDLPGVKEYSIQCGFPADVMTKRAIELGLAFTKEPPWSDAELDLLETHGYKSVNVIAAVFREQGFIRTATAIQLMRKRRMVHKASPYFSMNAVGTLFGIDSHVVKSWIKKGWLKFVMKGTARDADTHQNGDTHLIHKDWIYEFITKHPDAFEIKKVDQLWFLHITTRGDVKLAFSNKPGIRTEGQLIESPVENRLLKLRPRKKKGRPADLPSAEHYAHGTRARYVAGCRCDLCRKANSIYSSGREKAQRQGDFNGNVPAAHAKNYIEMLAEQGVGFKSVAKAAKVPHSTVLKIKSGEREFIRRSTETKILAVTSDAIAPGTKVSAAETWKRIDSLISLGYSKQHIAFRLGSTSKTPQLQIRRDKVTRNTALRVEAVYNQILCERGDGGGDGGGHAEQQISG